MQTIGYHPHLVSMIGCVTRGGVTPLALITEYCERGSLLSIVRDIADNQKVND